MHSVVQGIILGFIIVLPGMSGGTVLIILGIFEKVIKDLSRLNFKPYTLLLIGTAAGIFLGGISFSFLFAFCRDIAAAFLLGLLLASIKTVMQKKPTLTFTRLVILMAGLALAFFLANEPLGLSMESREVNWIILILGGAFSSAAMLIPGIPGSSILILLGIYDDMLAYLSEFAFLPLSIFGLAGLVGIVFLAKLLHNLYTRYQAPIAYFFAGLIAGSSRVLLPSCVNVTVVLAFLAGFLLVWLYGGERR